MPGNARPKRADVELVDLTPFATACLATVRGTARCRTGRALITRPQVLC